MAFLQITTSCDAARSGGTFDLAADETVIGRDASCSLSIEDPSISRQHARLSRSAEGWVVTDLGSSNGTRVNGERVTRVPLQAGDELRVGNTVLLLHGDRPVVDTRAQGVVTPAREHASPVGNRPSRRAVLAAIVLAGLLAAVVLALLLGG